MSNSPPQDLGVRLLLESKDLVEDEWVGGDAIALSGTSLVEATCTARFDGSTALTDTRFRWAVSNDPDDEDSWLPIAGERLDTGVVVTELVVESGGDRSPVKFATENHAASAYVRLEVKVTGGTPDGDDLAAAGVRFTP